MGRGCGGPAEGNSIKVLIAGGAGYIGSTIASACRDSGIQPVMLDDLSGCFKGLLLGCGDEWAALPGGGSAAFETADHGVDGGPADEGLGDGGVAFVVAGQPAVGGEPGQAAFHDPPLRVDREASLFGRFADDLQGRVQRAGGPVDEPAKP
jgi:hypothetical protein